MGKRAFWRADKIRAETARDDWTIFIADHVPSMDMTTTKTAVVCLDRGGVADSSRPFKTDFQWHRIPQTTDFWVSNSALLVGTEENLDDVYSCSNPRYELIRLEAYKTTNQ
jgi:hypothetical protein